MPRVIFRMMRVVVKVIPSAGHNRVEYVEDGSLKVYITASPQKGKANKKLLEVLSRFLGKRKSDLRIIRGRTSRYKIIEVDDTGR